MSTGSQTSRRLFLAAGSASAVFGALSQAAAIASTDADPIFEALEKVARARAAYEEAEGDAKDAAYRAFGDAEFDLLSTEPTTPAGAAKLLWFIGEFLDGDGIVDDDWAGDLIGDAIRNAVAMLEQGARS